MYAIIIEIVEIEIGIGLVNAQALSTRCHTSVTSISPLKLSRNLWLPNALAGAYQSSHCNCKLDAAIVESASKFGRVPCSRADLLQISRITGNVVVIIADLLIFAEVSGKIMGPVTTLVQTRN